ncbi:hypothetical protein SteCoe_26358 [Stentor coeruleus]|uniref:Cyclic nucleotide-binding domain-containing protein n=1 Tax=Stentor coeruleus TaxID=5963 RepID=A0A1R2BD41_9CILI|nr:hypothetical protein SteCoe_26358 [Stentor coeruleus]
MINYKEDDQEFCLKDERLDTVKRISTREFSNIRINKERIKYLWSKVRRIARVIGKFNKLNKDIRVYGANQSTKEAIVITDSKIKTRSARLLFSPTSKFKVFWNTMIVIFTLYTATVLPYELSFIDYSDEWLYIDGFIDCLFILDILITFNSAYIDVTGKLIISRKAITKQYLKSWFFVDLISSIPLEFFHTSSLENSSKATYNRFIKIIRVSRIYKILRMVRILKTLRLFRTNYMEAFFHWAKVSTNYARMVIFMTASIISVHVSGCFWYYISNIDEGNPNTWILRFGINNLSNFDKYIASIYFVFTTLTKIGYGDIYPINNDEKIFAIILMGFGAGLYSYIISGLCSFVTSREQIKSDIKEKINGIAEFAKAIKLPAYLFDRIKRNIKVNLKRNLHVSLDQTQLLREIPSNLREEILEFFNQRTVETILFFKDKPSFFINQVVPLLKSSVFVFKDIVYEENEAAEEVYFINTGRVHLKALNKIVFRTYIQGSYFGEIEIIEGLPRDSTATIASMEAQLFLLRKVEFMQALEDFPEIKDETITISKVRKLKQNEGKAHVLDLCNQTSQVEDYSLKTESESSELSTDVARSGKIHRKDTGVIVSIQNESKRKKRNRRLWSTVLDKNPKESIFHRTKTMMKNERIIDRSSSCIMKQTKSMAKKNEMRARYSSYLENNPKLKNTRIHIEYAPEKEQVDICEKYKLDDIEFSSSFSISEEEESDFPGFVMAMDNVLHGFDLRKESLEEKITDSKFIINESLNTQRKLKELMWRLGNAIQFRNL